MRPEIEQRIERWAIALLWLAILATWGLLGWYSLVSH
jgi:hypothetical protein